LPDQEAKSAVTWATTIATLGLNYQPHTLSQHSQRLTIFSHLYEETAVGYIPLQSLKLKKKRIFPQVEPLSEKQRQDAYHKLRQKLTTGLKAIQKTADPHTYLLLLNDLLRRITWCLPNPYVSNQATLPDTSLYDLSRVVAALAPCHAGQTSDKVDTLISGDISGVQDFIYTITARGATSGLRGRSLYLQLLTEAIAHYILTELELPITRLLYAGGGHFYIIAPTSAETAIPDLRRQISQILLRHHQGELYLALGCHTFNESDFRPQNFGSAWSQLSQDTSRAKRRRFSELDDEMYSQLFQLESSGGDKEQECRVCHYEAGPNEKMKVETDNLDDTKQPAFRRTWGNACRRLIYPPTEHPFHKKL
jgi:CRISPR-associated protein Csm1